MKDNQQMMAVTTQSMPVKVPPPPIVKVSGIFSTNGDEADLSDDESLRLHVSEDEDEEVGPDKINDEKKVSSTTEPCNESEDDILNKFDVADNVALENDDEKLEEKLLGEDELEGDAAKDGGGLGAKMPNGDCEKEDGGKDGGEANEKEGAGGSDLTKSDRTDESVKGSDEKVEDESATAATVGTEDASKEASTTTPEEDAAAKAEDDAQKEKVNAEFLKDQIMDTEDLLQIVDKVEENDKEENDNDKESSDKESSEKGDSDDVDMEGDDDTDKMDDEATDVDIEENNLSKPEFDSELDNEFKDMAKSKDVEADNASSKDGVATADSTKETENESDQPQDILVDKSTPKVSADKEEQEEEAKDKATASDDSEKIDEPLTSVEAVKEPLKKQASSEKTDDSSPPPADVSKSTKRSLSSTDESSDAKKLKLTAQVEPTIEPDESATRKEQLKAGATPKPPAKRARSKLDHLNAISEYMRMGNLNRFSFRDLEILCIQKACEAICHRSEIGELRHQLGVQEQMVEMWRKETAQLMKQARDLEIVNKRLLHEVKQKYMRDKPLIPVKITRSVGLQVRSDNNVISNVVPAPVKRRVARPSNPTNLQSTIAPAKQNRIMAANRAANAAKVTAAGKVMATAKIMTASKVTGTPVARTVSVTKTVTTVKTGSPMKTISTLKTISPIKTMPPVKATTSPTKVKMTPASRVLTPVKTVTTTTGPKAKALTPKSTSLLSLALHNSIAAAANNTSSTPTTPPTISVPNLIPITPVTTPTLTLTAPPTNTAPATASGTKTVTTTSKATKAVADKTVIDLTDEDDKKTVPNTGVRIVTAPVKSGTVVSTAGVVNPPRIMYMFNNQLHEGLLTDMAKPGGTQKLQLVKVNSNVIGSNGVLTAVQNGSAITVTSPSVRTTQVQQVRVSASAGNARTTTTTATAKSASKHPAPLPPPPASQVSLASRKPTPPKPHLTIKRANGGLILSWKMPYILENFESIVSYQLYAYQETAAPPNSEMWRKVGDVKALALPMACTLTQFADGNKYHFAVRAVDAQKRMGPFSDPEEILL